MKNKEIKKLARETFKASLGSCMLATLLFMVFITVILLITTKITDYNQEVGEYIAAFIRVVAYLFIYLGFSAFFLKKVRGEDAKPLEIFKPREHFIKFLGLELVVIVLIFICTYILLSIIINVFVGQIYSSVEIQTDVVYKLNAARLIGYIPGIIIGIIFSQLSFAFIDNADLSFGTIFEESVRIMKGNKIKFALLLLSYIGWFLLVIIASALGGNIPVVRELLGIICFAFIVFFIMPYLMLSLAYFYNDIIGYGKEKIEEKQEVEE